MPDLFDDDLYVDGTRPWFLDRADLKIAVDLPRDPRLSVGDVGERKVVLRAVGSVTLATGVAALR
jgi:hypothetical protein